MRTVELWNCAVELINPTIGDLKKYCGITEFFQIFPDNPVFWSCGDNLIVQPDAMHESEGSDYEKIANLILVFIGDYFKRPTDSRVKVTNISGLIWGDIILPCSAKSFARELKKRKEQGFDLSTISNIHGRVERWELYYSALTFFFEPLNAANDDPQESKLVSMRYSFGIPFKQNIRPELRLIN